MLFVVCINENKCWQCECWNSRLAANFQSFETETTQSFILQFLLKTFVSLIFNSLQRFLVFGADGRRQKSLSCSHIEQNWYFNSVDIMYTLSCIITLERGDGLLCWIWKNSRETERRKLTPFQTIWENNRKLIKTRRLSLFCFMLCFCLIYLLISIIIQVSLQWLCCIVWSDVKLWGLSKFDWCFLFFVE